MGISDDIKRKRTNHHSPTFELPNIKEVVVRQPERVHEEEAETAPIEPVEKETNTREEKWDDSVKNPFFDEAPVNSEKITKKSSSVIKALVWIIIFVAILGYGFYYSPYNPLKKSSSTTESQKTTESDQIQSEVVTQDYSTTSQSSTPSGTADSQSAATGTTADDTSTAAATTPDKSEITVRVLNGNGISGSAQKVRDTLTTAGFNVTSVSNAKTYSYTSTYLYYKKGKDTEAGLVKDTLTGRTVVLQESDTLAGSADIAVVVGKN
jgi:uncharacterized protein YpmB